MSVPEADHEEAVASVEASRRLGCCAVSNLLAACPVYAVAILGIWYAASGEITWLRWVLGIVGGVSAIWAVMWLPVLAMCLYGCVQLMGQMPLWIYAIPIAPVIVLNVAYGLPWWGDFLVLVAGNMLLAAIWASFRRPCDSQSVVSPANTPGEGTGT